MALAECILLCNNGKTLHIELKLAAPLTSAQEEWAAGLKRLGHATYLVRAKTPHEAIVQVENTLKNEGLLS